MVEPLEKVKPLMVAQEGTCVTCHHYKAGGNGNGWCLCNPPHAMLVPQQLPNGQQTLGPVSFFPTVADADRCGQHKKRARYDA